MSIRVYPWFDSPFHLTIWPDVSITLPGFSTIVMDGGLRTLDFEQGTLDIGQWTVEPGPRTGDHRLQTKDYRPLPGTGLGIPRRQLCLRHSLGQVIEDQRNPNAHAANAGFPETDVGIDGDRLAVGGGAVTEIRSRNSSRFVMAPLLASRHS